jgi:hypothetical protein
MPTESKAMKEIHKIRIKNRKATKNLSITERIDCINSESEKALKKMNNLKKSHNIAK